MEAAEDHQQQDLSTMMPDDVPAAANTTPAASEPAENHGLTAHDPPNIAEAEFFDDAAFRALLGSPVTFEFSRDAKRQAEDAAPGPVAETEGKDNVPNPQLPRQGQRPDQVASGEISNLSDLETFLSGLNLPSPAPGVTPIGISAFPTSSITASFSTPLLPTASTTANTQTSTTPHTTITRRTRSASNASTRSRGRTRTDSLTRSRGQSTRGERRRRGSRRETDDIRGSLSFMVAQQALEATRERRRRRVSEATAVAAAGGSAGMAAERRM